MGSKALDQWESMVNEVKKCEDHCIKVAACYTGGQANSDEQVKLNNVMAVTGLHQICVADFQSAKHRLNNVVL
jgi:hypothetical protein